MKRRAVNSVFLVQLSKKGGRDFPGLVRMKLRVKDGSFHSRIAVVFRWAECRGENLAEHAAGMSTGSAQEMQKGSAGRRRQNKNRSVTKFEEGGFIGGPGS